MTKNELRKLAGLPILEEKQVLTEALDQQALKHSMDALKSVDPSDKKGFEHSTNAMSASINDDHPAAWLAHKTAAEYHEQAGNKEAASHHSKADVHNHIKNPPKDSLKYAITHPDEDVPDDHPHKDVIDLYKKYAIKEDTITEKHHVKKKGKVVKVGSKKDCRDYCIKNDGCTMHKGEPDSLNETVLHDMLDQLITKIGKDYGVDFKDADGPAVRKAMAEIYHAGAGKGKYG